MSSVELRAGRPVLVRTGGAELRAEAAVLQQLAGPGAPEVVGLVDLDDGRIELTTALDPPLPLGAMAPWRVGAAVAVVLARAHDLGITHGPILDEHLRARDGEVVLSGWGHAAPGPPDADVAALGRLLHELADGDAELLALARRTTADAPPSMASLVETLVAGPHPAPRRLARRRWRAAPVVGTAVGALAVGALAVAGGVAWPREAPESAALSQGTIAPSTTTTTTPPTTSMPATPQVDGNVVTRHGARWTVGRPGDVVVVGDWACAGAEPVPAVLRPASGAVWLFAGWSAGGRPVPGRLLDRHPGAVALRVERDGPCDDLLVVDAAGTTMPLSPR